MLSSNLLPCRLLDQLLGDVAERDHAYCLPNAEPNARRDTSVQAPNTVLAVDIPERVPHGHLLGPIRVLFLRLHLHAHHLDRLVPSRKTTAESGGEDLFGDGEGGAIGFAGEGADLGFTSNKELVSGLRET